MTTSTPQTAEVNAEILANRVDQFNKVPGPRVGDYIELNHGVITRITHDHGNCLQAGGGSGSYYLGNGYTSYSGGLDDSISKTSIVPTNRVKPGQVWFFSENQSGAGRGVYYSIDFRVFKLAPGAEAPECYYRHLNPWTIQKLANSDYGYAYSAEAYNVGKTAFRTRHELKQWLKLTGLTINKRGYYGMIRLNGTFKTSSHMLNNAEFFAKYGHLEAYPNLCNGMYAIGFKEVVNGSVILHYQNPNTDRIELDRDIVSEYHKTGTDFAPIARMYRANITL